MSLSQRRLFVLNALLQLWRLEERPTPEKLDMIYRKGQYQLALNLAKTQGLDASSVADIHRQYGDHLYVKADYDGAMAQYVKTIGHLQPSYVIRKVSLPRDDKNTYSNEHLSSLTLNVYTILSPIFKTYTL